MTKADQLKSPKKLFRYLILLGLRLLNQGYKALYFYEVLGRGLLPNNLKEFRKQRFRWAYGAVRVTMRHLAILLGFKGQLTIKQRLSF